MFIRDRILSGDLQQGIIDAFNLNQAEYLELVALLPGIRDAHDVPHTLARILEGKTDRQSIERVMSTIATLLTNRKFNHFDEIRQKFKEILDK